VESGFIEMILFSINPAFDMRPATEDLDTMFAGYDGTDYSGIDPERAALYQLCEEKDVGLTVMKGFFGGKPGLPMLTLSPGHISLLHPV
jgi:hypothetical protein